MAERRVEPHLFVVLGGTGDLMRRKLLPALARLRFQGALDDNTHILAAARSSDYDDETYRKSARDSLEEAGLPADQLGPWCDRCVCYQSIGDAEPSDYERLASRIRNLEEEHDLPGNRVLYVALPPQAFRPTIEGLAHAGLHASRGWTRLVVEKPFGRDLASARELNELIHRHFDESQVYRIDHYLGKETVQNLLVFRFANAVFESLWNRDRIAGVQITVAEDVGVGPRAGYYEQAGALRDMIQNHATQLLTLIAMDTPVAYEAAAIRDEKVRVLRSITPPSPEQAVFGQYAAGQVRGESVVGYRDEARVASESQTETFAAVKLQIDNWRWQGVPFYLRTGKRMPRKLTEIAVVFREPPVCFFQNLGTCEVKPNVLKITVQPDEGFSLSLQVKAPGQPARLAAHSLDFSYGQAFEPLPDAYQTLLLDVVAGDQTLFVRSDEVEAAWTLYMPLLDNPPRPHPYPAGTWGPKEADRLLEHRLRGWENGSVRSS